MIEIKKPTLKHAPEISLLLDALGYPNTESFIEKRINELLTHTNEVLLIACENEVVLGVISLHFIPQLALLGDFCRISYLCVDKKNRNKGIGAMLEARAFEIAKERGCDRVEVHCSLSRIHAHRFYYRQGYVESPKYLCKSLHD